MTKHISYWRKHSQEVVRKVLAENAGKSEKEIRKAISEAYPFGERKYHPYKIWLDEVKIQTGKKKVVQYRVRIRKQKPKDPAQEVLL